MSLVLFFSFFCCLQGNSPLPQNTCWSEPLSRPRTHSGLWACCGTGGRRSLVGSGRLEEARRLFGRVDPDASEPGGGKENKERANLYFMERPWKALVLNMKRKRWQNNPWPAEQSATNMWLISVFRHKSGSGSVCSCRSTDGLWPAGDRSTESSSGCSSTPALKPPLRNKQLKCKLWNWSFSSAGSQRGDNVDVIW